MCQFLDIAIAIPSLWFFLPPSLSFFISFHYWLLLIILLNYLRHAITKFHLLWDQTVRFSFNGHFVVFFTRNSCLFGKFYYKLIVIVVFLNDLFCFLFLLIFQWKVPFQRGPQYIIIKLQKLYDGSISKRVFFDANIAAFPDLCIGGVLCVTTRSSIIQKF